MPERSTHRHLKVGILNEQSRQEVGKDRYRGQRHSLAPGAAPVDVVIMEELGGSPYGRRSRSNILD